MNTTVKYLFSLLKKTWILCGFRTFFGSWEADILLVVHNAVLRITILNIFSWIFINSASSLKVLCILHLGFKYTASCISVLSILYPAFWFKQFSVSCFLVSRVFCILHFGLKYSACCFQVFCILHLGFKYSASCILVLSILDPTTPIASCWDLFQVFHFKYFASCILVLSILNSSSLFQVFCILVSSNQHHCILHPWFQVFCILHLGFKCSASFYLYCIMSRSLWCILYIPAC